MEEVSLDAVAHALTVLRHAAPELQRRLLHACVECAVHDHTLETVEAEMLRAIAEALDCPMPPLLRG